MQKTDTIGNIVATDIRTAHVFKQHNIDFCCGGGISLEKACATKGVNADELIEELEKSLQAQSDKQPDFKSWKPGFLCDYIENEHHNYVRQNLPLLLQYANKVANVHGPSYAYLVEMRDRVIDLSHELTPHLMKEEQVLFPYVKQLEIDASVTPVFGTVKNPIQAMMNEHDHAGDILKNLADLSDHFTPPSYACNTWMAYYDKLKEFENDLHLHIHLENNILFPKALELEESAHSIS